MRLILALFVCIWLAPQPIFAQKDPICFRSLVKVTGTMIEHGSAVVNANGRIAVIDMASQKMSRQMVDFLFGDGELTDELKKEHENKLPNTLSTYQPDGTRITQIPLSGDLDPEHLDFSSGKDPILFHSTSGLQVTTWGPQYYWKLSDFRVLDPADGKVVAGFQPGTVTGFALTHNGKTLFRTYPGEEPMLISRVGVADSNQQVSVGHNHGLLISPDDGKVVVLGDTPRLYRWNGEKLNHQDDLVSPTLPETGGTPGQGFDILLAASQRKGVSPEEYIEKMRRKFRVPKAVPPDFIAALATSIDGRRWSQRASSFSGDSRFAVLVQNQGGNFLPSSSITTVWDLEKGVIVARLNLSKHAVQASAISSDGRFLTAALNPEGESYEIGGAVTVFDLQTGRKRELKVPQMDGVSSLAYSPDNSRIIGGTNRGRVLEWQSPPVKK